MTVESEPQVEPTDPRGVIGTMSLRVPWLAGVGVAAVATVIAWGVSWWIPAVPMLTAAIALGIIVAQIPACAVFIDGVLAPGLRLAARRLMRIGIVLLGLKLSLVDIANLGWLSIVTVVGILVVTFVMTLWLGRLFGLPGNQSLLVATGFSICGASAIGAMSGVLGVKDKDTATPIALVTLCGTLAVAVLPLLWFPLGLDALQFGRWVGASVHDVGQVVATAQVAGTSALAVAVAVKLTRVLMLAPMVAVTSVIVRRKAVVAKSARNRVPLMPLFVVGFLVAVLVRTLLPLQGGVLDIADIAQTALLGMALFGLGTAVRLKTLVRTGWRALIVALLSWFTIAALAYGAVQFL